MGVVPVFIGSLHERPARRTPSRRHKVIDPTKLIEREFNERGDIIFVSDITLLSHNLSCRDAA
jgi:hypothetical protein